MTYGVEMCAWTDYINGCDASMCKIKKSEWYNRNVDVGNKM